MAAGIVATEEVRDDLALNTGGTATQVAERLAVNTSTVRRHLRLLVERGWAKERYDLRSHSYWYALTDRGLESYRQNEGF